MSAERSQIADQGKDGYRAGLSRIREGVISSHFMHRVSLNPDIRLYEQESYGASCLKLDTGTLTDKLLPILKAASTDYCRKRMETARARARKDFRAYGHSTADAVGPSEFITEAILDKEFSRNAARYNDKMALNLRLKQLIHERQPVEMVIPALPFKIQSPLKARGPLPDFAEVNFLLSLYEITKVVEGLYAAQPLEEFPKIATFTVVSDGLRFHEAVNTSSAEVALYQSALADWVRRLGLEAYIHIVDYRDLLCDRLSKEEQAAKARLFEAAHAKYSETMWPLFDPDNFVDALEAAACVEPDPEQENPQGRFASLVKSLIFTVNYRTLQELDDLTDSVRADLYRELTSNIFHPCTATAPTHDMERLRRSMLQEVWEAAIYYIAEIKSDRDQHHDPILACLPGHLRWTIHRKHGQIAIATPPIQGMAVQAWAGSAVFRPAGRGKIRLCSLPVVYLEATGAIPIVGAEHNTDGRQALFYVDKALGITDMDGLLQALATSYSRLRFS